MTTYELCKQLLTRGKLTIEKLDVYLAADRITPEQYRELAEQLKPEG